ncbi:Ni/Fe hydrogenase subunit alpha [Patescibacteria group bacterium]
MHTTDLDINIEDISKIEGHASVDIKIRNGKVTDCRFSITEMRRFYMQAIRGIPAISVPTKVARICGTCSNAHLLCSLEAVEKAYNINISPQTKLLRELLNFALIIRDHALHLYIFVLPDYFEKDSILDFDENNKLEHQMLHDCFEVKNVGNKLAISVGGRSVHAPFLRVGGFSKIPTIDQLQKNKQLLIDSRAKILNLIDIFEKCTWNLTQDVKFVALVNPSYSFLDGIIKTSDGRIITEENYRQSLSTVKIPYSEATGYQLEGQTYFTGALARINLNREALHTNTQKDTSSALSKFPSNNIYHNNLAQAIEILHSIDSALDLIDSYQGLAEEPHKITPIAAFGAGLIEAPRGILTHHVHIGADGNITKGNVIVPTGQNQTGIENAIRDFINVNTEKDKKWLTKEIEKIIRAYDPCMSCATHFLKVNWK